jgi:hypothetical protein
MTALDDGIRAAAAAAVERPPILYIISLTAVLDDADDGGIRWFDVVADQRDQRLATQLVADPDADKIGFGWATAWACLHRTNRDPMSWDYFKAHVLQVMPTEGIPVATPVDPTRPAPAG